MTKNTLRALWLSLLLLLTAATAQAQLAANQRLLGYSVTDDIGVSGAAFGQAGTFTIGALLTADDLSSYAGCRVVGLRVAVARNMGRSRTFIYNNTDSGLTPIVEQNQRLYEGWNTVYFNGDGYLLTGTESLFYGYDYTETDEMVAAEEGALCCVGNDVTGAFYLYGNYGQGQTLYPITGAGMLCVQLIVDVSSLPRYDLSLTYLDSGFKYKQPAEDVTIMATYGNTGRDTICHCVMAYRVDDADPVLVEVADTLLPGERDTWVKEFALPADIATGLHRVTVYVHSIEGETPGHPAAMAQSFAVYRNTMNRDQAYLEVYTDQASPYSAMLNSAVSLVADNSNRVAIANIHRDGTPLAVAEATYLHDLYAYTWPTFTVNRSYFPGEAHIAYDMNDYLPVIPASMSAGILSDVVMQDYYTPAFASVALSADYDADSRRLDVTAHVQALPEARLFYDRMALTLMMVEDGVKSPQAVYSSATGRTSTSQNYVHNHVLRGFLTAPIGTPITSAGGEDGEQTADDGADNAWDVPFTTTLDADWQPDNLRIIALLTKAVDSVSADNLRDVDVVNCNSIALGDLLQGVQSVTLSREPDDDCYTLSGMPVDASTARPGLYVRGGKKIVIR